MDLQLIAEDFQFPEGPIAMNDGSVILTEIKRQTLTRVKPDGSKEILVNTGGGPNGAAIGPDGAIYITNNGGAFEWLDNQGMTIPGPTPPSHTGGYIQRFDLKTGALTTLYTECDGRKLVGPNDIVFDRQGGFWFSDHGCSTPEGRKFGAIYYAKIDGSHISRQRDHIISPNGIGLSPDEKVVYLADTNLGRLWAFDVAEPGVLGPPDGFAPGRVVCNLPGYQLLDSLAVEAGGKVCVATIINGGITAFDPDGSVEHFPVPDLVTTNICFGGPDMRTAWITASATGKLYRATWPRPGLKLNFQRLRPAVPRPPDPREPLIVASFERAAELCEDLTPPVYDRLFREHPAMEALFWRDTNHQVRGEMLSRVIQAILDFVGERLYSRTLIQSEVVVHEGYDVPPDVFRIFFRTVRDALREVCGDDWTQEWEAAWASLLEDLDWYVTHPDQAETGAPA